MDIKYTIKKTTRHDGKTVWRVYENNIYLDEFMSYERAVNYIRIYKEVMR